MRKAIVSTLPLLGLALIFIRSSHFIKADATSQQPPHGVARLSDEISVRGRARINLNEGRDLVAAYVGDPRPRQMLEQNLAEPLALASADFDEDGTPDLISGYRSPGGGIITLHRGNVDAIYPNSPEAQRRKASGEFTDAPFLSPARVFEIPMPAEFVAAGDFDADGHSDVAAADRGSEIVHLLLGDGQGEFGAAEQIRLPGGVTKLGSGEVNRRDGLADIVIGVVRADGPKVIVLASPEGALKATPEIFTAMPEIFTPLSSAGAPALGQLDDDYRIDVEGEPIAVLPMRLNADALSDLIILRKGEFRITLVPTSPNSVFRVTNTDDSGAGSLREAITLANQNPGPDTIVFDIQPPGPKTISPFLPLPPITDPTTIDGTTQPGFAGTPIIELNGALVDASSADGLLITSGPSTVRGLVINRFPGGSGIALDRGGAGSIVEGNFIGTDIGGTADLGNDLAGVTINNSANNRIGGTATPARNIISGNDTDGILVLGSAATGNTIQGNFIGTNAGGTAALGNSQRGVRLDSALNTVVGGTTAQARNLISGNGAGGILMTMAATGNQVQGNFIGTQVDGASALGNGGSGIETFGSNNNIGGTAAGAGNRIAFSSSNGSGNGVSVGSGTGNAILSNAIFSNSALGIELGADGETPNDPCDPDGGPNNLQNFPVLTSATTAGTSLTIQGTLNSTPGTTFRVEFFSNPACDTSGFGEGQTFIGSTSVVTSPSCVASINVTLPVSVPASQVITATATDPSNNTSEFSQCVIVTAPPCVITCPPAQTVNTSPNQCGAVVSFPAPTTSGQCSPVTCTPASGSFFPVGTTTVTCAEVSGDTRARCSFTVTVVDNTPPRVTCPANIRVPLPPGQQSAVADYVIPSATDNCPGTTTVICLPPSGTSFPVGTTTVTCTATDAARNTNSCSFTVTVIDTVAPTISCPANVVANAAQGQCVAAVSYPAPTASDNLPGTTVACVPPTGSTFPAGTTPVTCTATDAAGNRASCSFAVTVNAPPQARVTLEGNRSALEFGPADPLRKAKRNPPPDCDCDSTFTIENTGCVQLRLTLSSIMRMGPDTTNGRITNADDRLFFLVRLVNPDQTEVEIDVGGTITIQPGQRRNFRALFRPVIPAAFPGKTTGLSATDVLPNLITSRLVFTQDGGSPIAINLNGRVSTQVQLINPSNPRRAKRIIFERSGNEFTVTAAAFDSNLNTKRIRFEFLNSRDQVVGQAIEVDLVEAIRASNIIAGQSFIVVQRFSGARSNRGIVSVRVTIFDDEGSDSTTGALQGSPTGNLSVQSLRPRGAVLFLPEVRLDSWLP